MRYVIFSDIQGNLEAINIFNRCINQTYPLLKKDYVICLGDIINRGNNYSDNRVIDSVRGLHSIRCVKGNHEEKIKDEGEYRINQENLDFLRQLPISQSLEDLLFFHSSLANPGKRLKTKDDIKEEAKYISQNRPDSKFILFGHSHQAGIFSYDCRDETIGEIDVKIDSIPMRKNIPLDDRLMYFINPGGIGLYYGLAQTFAILDTEKSNIHFYTLDQLEDMDAKRNLIYMFAIEWMPHLKGDEWSWNSLKKDLKFLRENNKGGRFDEIIRIMEELNPPNSLSKKKEYYKQYSLKLANAIEKIATKDIMSSYLEEDDEPLKARNFWLNHETIPIGGIQISKNLIREKKSNKK